MMKSHIPRHSAAHFFVLVFCALVQVQSFPDSEECGLIDNSSFGDVRTGVPWMASIFRKSKTNCSEWVLWKSGYIIGRSTVLMSGRHFWNYTTNNAKIETTNSKVLPIRPSEFLVGVGVLSDDLRDADFYTHYFHVQSITPHFRSYRKYSAFDVAVIQLKESIRFNAYIRPICISNGWNDAPVQNFSSIMSAPAVKAGFGSNGGFQYLYSNPVVLYDYPLDKDCAVNLKQKTPLTSVEHEELPIKRCVDLDSGLSYKRNDRWYLAALMTGGILPDPEAEAWTFFSPIEKTYFWVHQNLICGSENFTCYEGKCLQTPNAGSTSLDLLLACGERENKYGSVIEAQETCNSTDGILRNWCNDCPDLESEMLAKGEEFVETTDSTTVAPQSTTAIKSELPTTAAPEPTERTTLHPETTSDDSHGIPKDENEGTKISISPSNVFLHVPSRNDNGEKTKPTTIEWSSSQGLTLDHGSNKNNYSENKKMCSFFNLGTLCNFIKT